MANGFMYTRADNARRGAYRRLATHPPRPGSMKLAVWRVGKGRSYTFTLTKVGFELRKQSPKVYKLIREF